MRVQAKKNFAAQVPGLGRFRAEVGDEFDLPAGVDWVEAGLVEPVSREPETAAVKPGENAMRPRAAERPTQPALDQMSQADLYELAQQHDISGRSKMTQDELIAALKKHFERQQK